MYGETEKEALANAQKEFAKTNRRGWANLLGAEIDLLNRAGGEGWELVSVTSNGIAILQRDIGQPAKAGRRRALESTQLAR